MFIGANYQLLELGLLQANESLAAESRAAFDCALCLRRKMRFLQTQSRERMRR